MTLETYALPTTEQEAVEIVREFYGFVCVAKSLPGEYDNNFYVNATDGREFVLKVMHPARERSFIDLQSQALRHLAQRAPQLALPRVIPAKNGEFFHEIHRADGTARWIWMLTFVKGTVLVDARPHSPELLRSIGRLLGEMDAGLQSFSHPAAERELKWDLARAEWIGEYLRHISNETQRKLVQSVLERYKREVLAKLPELRRTVVYGDANDYNVLVGEALPLPRKAVSVIDFGDMHYSVTVSEIAIACAYAILGKKNLLAAAAEVVAGYHDAFALEEEEIAVLHTLIGMRLAVSVTNSAYRKTLKPDDAYVTVSEAPAWEALESWWKIHPRLAEYSFRAACGWDAVPHAKQVAQWLKVNGKSTAPILKEDIRNSALRVFDLSVGSTFLGADPETSSLEVLTEKIFGEMKHSGVSVGVGRYDEARLLYTSPLFRAGEKATEERRTIHLGIDLFAAAETEVFAPLDGIVEVAADNTAALDYGPVVVLRHETKEGLNFFTLYGHLTKSTLEKLTVGQKIVRGAVFAKIGTASENGGWAPHLHFQIMLDLLELGADFPGVARASECEVWTTLSPDPNLLLGIPESGFPSKEKSASEMIVDRREWLGKNLSVSYESPLKIVRGWKQYLYDETGRAFLDVYNNVPLVGHSHPRVVKAAQEQLELLNTNTRYLHENVNRYAKRLTMLMPEPLRVCFFVNSGSEANELALRLARTHTNREDVLVLEHAYHGHTNTLIDISPYKFDGPGGKGKKDWVHVAPLADEYRGIYRRGEKELGKKYAKHVETILGEVKKHGRGVAAYIAETLPSVGGQIVFPPEYLSEVYRYVHAAGGICIADEVQVGFGRLGTHFWGFETQGVIPDIVVLGKPIGNAFPLAAVVTTAEIAESFANGMEFFTTFGGNPVACAVGLAVLDVLEEEKLQENALRVGEYWMNRLKELQKHYALIGDVRGSGLFLGIDLVRNRETREAATVQASYVVNRLRECGVLAGTDGPFHNVIKLRPPLCFTEKDADLFLEEFDTVLREDGAQV